MSAQGRTLALFAAAAALVALTGTLQSWNAALLIVNMGLVSAIMSLGLNLQWGVAGLFNVGITGFVALGGMATVLISMPPAPGAWALGGAWRILLGLAIGAAVIAAALRMRARMAPGRRRALATAAALAAGFVLYRLVFDGGVLFVEAITPASTGNVGGVNPWGGAYREHGWFTLLAWPAGGLLAAGAAIVIGRTALGLRSDYLAIATLGIAEIVIAVMKNEDWLVRGVKNVIGLPRPVPYEVDLQASPAFADAARTLGADPVTASTLFVKFGYSVLFTAVLLAILLLAELALRSPWGRMMRAIRDNELAAAAVGKHITFRHLQVFVLGSAVCGVAGAMMTTLDGQLTPTSYQPLRFTFLIWIMVIVGGSGNNLGAALGGFFVWFFWVQGEPMGRWVLEAVTAPMADASPLKAHLLESAAHMRVVVTGLVLLLVLRFNPRGLLPER